MQGGTIINIIWAGGGGGEGYHCTFYKQKRVAVYKIHVVSPLVSTSEEGNVLFNDALNTFFYGYMASDI